MVSEPRPSGTMSGERSPREESSAEIVVETSATNRSLLRGVPIQYPMLTEMNYSLWVVKMKIILRSLRVWAAIEGITSVEEEIDQGALAAISQSVPDAVLMAIADKETAKAAWNAIQEIHVGEDRVKKARVRVLKRQFDRLIMEDSETVTAFSQKLSTLVGEIRSLNTDIKDSSVVEKLFGAVPDRFLPIVGTIEQWGDLTTMTFTEATGRLRAFEESLKGRHSEKIENRGDQLMLTRSQWESLVGEEKKAGENWKEDNWRGEGHGDWQGGGRGQLQGAGPRQYRKGDKSIVKCFNCNGFGHYAAECRKPDKSKIKCFNCNVYGHYASECKKPKRERANFVEKPVDEDPTLLLTEACDNRQHHKTYRTALTK